MDKGLIVDGSLWRTVEQVDEAFFWGRPIEDKETLAEFLASRQGLPGAYGSLFAPFPGELREGATSFTGGKLTRTAAKHIVGEVAYRLLRMLGVESQKVEMALEGAERALLSFSEEGRKAGRFCCGNCSVAFWRSVALFDHPVNEQCQLAAAGHLERSRLGDGTWRNLPFEMALLGLLELRRDIAAAELRYAAPRACRLLSRKATGAEPYLSRRREILQRAVEVAG